MSGYIIPIDTNRRNPKMGTDIEVIGSALKIAIVCPVGSRFMNRQFGSGVQSYRGNYTDVLSSSLGAEIQRAAGQVPNARVNAVRITPKGDTVFVSIPYSTPFGPGNISLTQ